MKVIVCGGRDYNDAAFLNKELNQIHKKRSITRLIQGGATGADTLANRWAAAKRIECKTYMANWKMYGKTAGPIRNKQMLIEEKPDLVIAFPGGQGTADMKKQARIAGVEVKEYFKKKSMANFTEPSNDK